MCLSCILFYLKKSCAYTYLKPTASSEGAPLWVSKDAHTLFWFREAGPMYCP